MNDKQLLLIGYVASWALTCVMLGYVGPTLDAETGVSNYFLKLQLQGSLTGLPSELPPSYLKLIWIDYLFPVVYGTTFFVLLKRYGDYSVAITFSPLIDMVANFTETTLQYYAVTGGNLSLLKIVQLVAIIKWIALGVYFIAVHHLLYKKLGK